MASVVPRKNKSGDVTSYQVKWRLGGARSGDWQIERFDGDEDGKAAAGVFCDAVNEHGQQWPPGWVKGRGYIDPMADVEEQFIFRNYARECIKNRTGIEKKYRNDCYRELETYILPTFANCDVRSTEHFSKATIGAWVNLMAATKVWRGSKHKEMSPKTLKNLHGLLSSILKEAVVAEPPLRDRNPCDLTRLPRFDDDGIEDDEASDEMEFMTPDEIAGLVSCFKRPEDRILVRVAYGTGMRWGEITALAKRQARNPAPSEFEIRVSRAWKRDPDKGVYLGKPKSKASRRTIEISGGLWQELLDLGMAGMASSDLIFHNGSGERLPYATFYDRWIAAVADAKDQGLLPDWKFPTFHDLRHSHVAALLSDRHSLTYVQRRLGHESIKTTSDRYGHLLKTAHQGALATIDRALGLSHASSGEDIAEDVPVKDPGQSLYVAHVGSKVLGFWKPEHAEETAERWACERGGAVRVEKWSAEWWIRTVGGQVGSDNGLKAVRSELPHRSWIWSAGPAVYGADGTERVTDPGVHEPVGRWVWDWEDAYTEEPAHSSTEWLSGPGAETAARAWGPERDAVCAAYAGARADALRVCGLHPALRGSAGVHEAVQPS